MSTQPDVIAVAQKLTSSSLKNSFDTFNRVSYQEKLNPDALQFPEEFLSLYHHPIYGDLTDEQKWKLSMLETVNFFSANIFGEQHLISHMEKKIYRNKFVGEDAISSEYAQHFIHEENAHTFMLAGYCVRYHGQVMPNRSIAMADPKLSPYGEDLLFFARTYVLEMFLGYMNRTARERDDIDDTVRQIHYFHLLDEVRHIAWDRAMVEGNLWEMHQRGLSHEIPVIKELVKTYAKVSFNSLYNPRIYKDIGLENPSRLGQEAAATAARQAQVDKWSQGFESYLFKIGFYTGEDLRQPFSAKHALHTADA
jgi:hypothetical protein